VRDFVWPHDWRAAPGTEVTIRPIQVRNPVVLPGAVAYLILRQVYRQFGLPDDAVPFVEDQVVREDLLERP
jgi:hypothetical protein